MLINTDLSSDTTLASRQNLRPETGANASPSPADPPVDSSSSQLDPSLQRLTDTPSFMQDDDFGIQDGAGASHAVDFLRHNMMNQPATAMAAQGHSLPQSVLSLLQPID